MKKLTILTVAIIAVVIALPVIGLVLRSGSKFGGADSGGQAAITKIDPGYKPWFNSLWNQSVQTNEIMFGVQGVVGGAILFSVLGYMAGRTRGRAEATAGKESPISTWTGVAYVVIGVGAFAVVPVLYFVLGYRPPSSEVICLFFALEGAIASGFILFALTFSRGRRRGRSQAGLQSPTEPQPSGGAS